MDSRTSHLKMRSWAGRESPRQAAEQRQGPRTGARLACPSVPGTQQPHGGTRGGGRSWGVGSELHLHYHVCRVFFFFFFFFSIYYLAASGLRCFATCGILVCPPGIKPMSPVLQGGFLTPGPSGKSLALSFLKPISDSLPPSLGISHPYEFGT